MKWAFILLLFAYVSLKAAQFAFAGRASGYRREPMSLRRRLKAGEPAILIVAALVSVPPALAATWYRTHKFTAIMHQSVDCYGLIAVYRSDPEVMRSNGEHAVYNAYREYRGTAFDAGRQLDLSTAAVQKRLDSSASALAAEKPNAGAKTRRSRIDTVQHCLHPPREPANE